VGPAGGPHQPDAPSKTLSSGLTDRGRTSPEPCLSTEPTKTTGESHAATLHRRAPGVPALPSVSHGQGLPFAWDEGITTVFCGWVCLGENVRDPANWKRVAVEASQETAQDVMDKEARRVGALRTLLTMGGNPAEPMIWITDREPRSLESLVDRLDRLAREGNRENP